MSAAKSQPSRTSANPLTVEYLGAPHDRRGIEYKKKSYLLTVLDYETDPFEQDVVPEPFCVGVYDAYEFKSYWAPDCSNWFVQWLETRPDSIVYAHNGGNFDFMFLRPWWRGQPKIINGRITEVQIGRHILRDSYKILPVPLRDFQTKKDIDYNKLKRAHREKNRVEIIEYLKWDCITLFDNVKGFIDEFGFNLTIGSAAIHELERFHEYEHLSPGIDAWIRDYFFGGRNQCFEVGELKGKWNVYDVNSMYPYVMRNFKHPIGEPTCENKIIRKGKTAFITVEGKNYGALPSRAEDGSLDFTVEKGTFRTTIHEFEAALATGTFEPTRILNTIEFSKWGTFEEFVDHFYTLRLKAKKDKNAAKIIFYKLVLNNAYGKFASNPANFSDYAITDALLDPKEGWQIHAAIGGGFHLWGKPITVRGWHYFNVATGASITGAARATLLRALAKAKRPIYCDTDSIICEALDADLDASKLGAWKHEGDGSHMAIAGKKTYTLYKPVGAREWKAIQKELEDRGKSAKRTGEIIRGKNCEIIKRASKGAELTAGQIIQVANGDTVEYANKVPKFKLSGKILFVKRRIRKTAKNVRKFGGKK
jgi:hypothetical protein